MANEEDSSFVLRYCFVIRHFAAPLDPGEGAVDNRSFYPPCPGRSWAGAVQSSRSGTPRLTGVRVGMSGTGCLTSKVRFRCLVHKALVCLLVPHPPKARFPTPRGGSERLVAGMCPRR